MRVMRSNLDGSEHRDLVDTSHGDPRPGPDPRDGVSASRSNPERGHFTGPKRSGEGRTRPPPSREIEIPKGENAANRTDIEILFDGLPEPSIWSSISKTGYVLDRPRPIRRAGNTVNRAPMDADFQKRPAPGDSVPAPDGRHRLAIDFKGGRMFITDLAGSVYSRAWMARKSETPGSQANLTGIAYVNERRASRRKRDVNSNHVGLTHRRLAKGD